MNRSELKKRLPILQAYADGKDVELFSAMSSSWIVVGNDCARFLLTDATIRIKPVPVWRPWTFDECPVVFVIISKDHPQLGFLIVEKCDDGVIINGRETNTVITTQELFDYYDQVLADNTRITCGILATPTP